MLGAALLDFSNIFNSLSDPVFYIGFLVSAVVGILTIHFLLKFVKKFGFFVFALYRVVLAVALFFFCLGKLSEAQRILKGTEMPDKIRKSILARLIAIGFIYIIVLGNIWFAQGVSGSPTPEWMIYGFFGGIAWVFTLVLGLRSIGSIYGRPIVLTKVKAMESSLNPRLEFDSGTLIFSRLQQRSIRRA